MDGMLCSLWEYAESSYDASRDLLLLLSFRYFIYGMQDEQNLERVMLEFEKFNIPETTHDSCGDGYLKVRKRQYYSVIHVRHQKRGMVIRKKGYFLEEEFNFGGANMG